MTHPNADLIRLKLKELRAIGLMPTQHGLVDQVLSLLEDKPKRLYSSAPTETNELISIAQTKRRAEKRANNESI